MYKVLIVDPDANELNMLADVIHWEDNGLKLVGFLADSRHALRFLITTPVDILIMKVSCPELDGISLLQQVREQKPQLRCIFTADAGDIHYAQQAIPLGIDNFLVKPLDSRVLLRTLQITKEKLREKHADQAAAQIHGDAMPFFRLLEEGDYSACLACLDSIFPETPLYDGVSFAILQNTLLELLVSVIMELRRYHIDDTKVIGDSAAVFQKLFQFTDSEDLQQWLTELITTAMEALENKNARSSPCIARVVALIEKNYAQDISLKTIAHDLNINAAYLGQLFKAETGQLFSAFLNKTRIKNAQRLLLQTTLSLYDISQQCGYSNISYFYNLFKKYTGKTPSQYRKTKIESFILQEV